MKIIPLVVICSLVITAAAYGQSSSSDFLKDAAQQFERDSDRMNQEMQNDITNSRLQRLENERIAEVKRKEAAQAAAIANHDSWLRKANSAFSASWDRSKNALMKDYPDLKNPKTTMFLLFQRIAQDYREQESPILLDASAARLIADNAARQLGIDRRRDDGARQSEGVRSEQVTRQPETPRGPDIAGPKMTQTEEQQRIQHRSEFLNAMEESKSEIIALYPDAAAPDSSLSRRTLEIADRLVDEKNPTVRSPKAPLLVTEMAAKELGIAPKR